MPKEIIKNGYRIKYVDFSKQKKDKRLFNKSVGLCDFDNKTIYVDKKLGEDNQGSKELCLNHELAHARLGSIEVDEFTFDGFEELFVELEALTRTKNGALTIIESMLKTALTNGEELDPKNKEDFYEIVRNICSFINIKLSKKYLKILADGDKNENE